MNFKIAFNYVFESSWNEQNNQLKMIFRKF